MPDSFRIRLLRKIAQSQAKREQTPNPSNFLIVSTTGVGDTLWGTPAIESLKKTYPNSNISCLVSPLAKEVLLNNPNIDEFFVFERGFKSNFSLISLYNSFKRKKFDAVFIFHNSFRLITPLCSLTNAPIISGIERHAKELKDLLTHPMAFKYEHPTKQRLTLLEPLNVTPVTDRLKIYLTEKERDKANEFLKNKGIQKNERLIGFQPGAHHTFKQWPVKHFIELGNLLYKKYNCRILVTGSPNELPLSQEIVSQIPKAISSTGKLPLRVSASLLKEMDLLITNDTGPMHIAFAEDTPTVALFSPTGADLCDPYSQEEHVRVLYKEPTCKPCIRHRCFKPYCMERISVPSVFEACKSILD